VINDKGDIHMENGSSIEFTKGDGDKFIGQPDIQENMENQSMQEQLEHDPDYIAWAKTQEMTEAEKDQMAKDLEGEVF